MFAQVIGVKLTFKQTLLALFMSFTIASIILASLTPVTLFILANIPPIKNSHKELSNSIITITHVIIIAFAGVISNVRLYQFLYIQCSKSALAKKILIAWLCGNMFLGCQLSWNLRPFIGTTNLEIQLFRPNPLHGNFYIDIYNKIKYILVPKERSKHGTE